MIVNMLKSIVRWAVLASWSSDLQDFPTHKITYMGKVADATAWYPYGYHANPGIDTLGLMFAVNADSENRVVLPGSPKDRNGTLLPTPLSPGEVLLYNPTTQAFVHLKANGDIDIENSVGDINIKSISGDIKAETTTGDIIANAVNATLTALGITQINSTGAIDITALAAVTLDSVGKTTITGTGTVEIDGNTLVDLIAALIKASNGGAVSSLCNEAFLALFNSHTHAGTGPPNNVTAVVGTDTTTVLKGE